MALAKFFCQAMSLLFFQEEKSINKNKTKKTFSEKYYQGRSPKPHFGLKTYPEIQI